MLFIALDQVKVSKKRPPASILFHVVKTVSTAGLYRMSVFSDFDYSDSKVAYIGLRAVLFLRKLINNL